MSNEKVLAMRRFSARVATILMTEMNREPLGRACRASADRRIPYERMIVVCRPYLIELARIHG